MKNALVALAVIVPTLVHADDRGNRPYALVNGRSAESAAAIVSRVSTPPSAPQTGAVSLPASGQRGVMNGSQAVIGRRASGGRPQGHKSFWAGKRSADGGGATTPTEAPPPHFSKPGAFIRTEGQQPQYTQAAPARTHTVEGGSFIDIDNNKAQDVGRAPGLRQGPKDTLPTPNLASGSRSGGGNSITPNSTTNVTNNNTTNGNQNGGNGNGNGRAHDKGFGGGTGFDPAF